MKTQLSTKDEIRVGGNNWQERQFVGFLINGKSLREMLDTDNISGLGWGTAEEQTRYVEQLLGKQVSELESKRTPLYLCAECGDLGCGAITIEVQRTEGKVIWANFGYETNYEAGVKPLDGENAIGPFEFDESEYEKLLNSLRSGIK